MKLGKIKNNFSYRLHGENIELVDSMRDLGIIIDESLKFEEHINKITKAANFRQYNMLRILPKKLDLKLKISAYKTYVRPMLEYATEVYNPKSINLKKKLEKPQRSFTKRVLGISKNKNRKSYSDRLKICGIDTLELRRSRSDLLTTFKIINGLYDVPSHLFFTPPPVRLARRHQRTVFMPHMPRTKIAQNYFSIRVIHNWNNLPSQIGKFKLDDIYNSERFGQFLDKLSPNAIIPVPCFDYERPQ